MQRKIAWLNFEVVGSICAMLLSIVAVFIAWQQSVLMEEQNHASVWPIVDIEITLDRNEQANFLAIEMRNVGVGPAMVRAATLTINGEVATDFTPFEKHILKPTMPEGTLGIEASSFIDVVGAGETKNVLKFNWPRSEEYDAAFMKMAGLFVANPDLMDVEICYCSVFERCWQTVDDVTLSAMQVEACQIQKRDIVATIVATATQNLNKQLEEAANKVETPDAD